MRPHSPETDHVSPASRSVKGYVRNRLSKVWPSGTPGIRQRTRCPSRRVSARRTSCAASHSASGLAAAERRWWVRTAGPGIQSSRRSSARYGDGRGMRLIQHKKEAYWFYRFLSTGYDRWVNPLFWTPAMRSEALRGARVDERSLEILDAGAGTGFTTEGIVEAIDADCVTMLDQS